MSLENEIKKLTAAVEANTAALLGGAAPAAPVAEKKAEAPKAEAPKAEAPSVDFKTLTTKIMDYAKAKGREAVSALLNKYGATKVPELKDKPETWGEIAAFIEGELK